MSRAGTLHLDVMEGELERRMRGLGESMQPADPDMLARTRRRLLDDHAEPRHTRHIGRFQVRTAVGGGGQGVVYDSWDEELGRRVAIKVLHPRRDWMGLRRLLTAEARALASLNHEHVLHVFEIGEHDGELFIATEFMDGGDLEDWLAQRRGLDEIVECFAKAGRGLG